MIRLPSSRARAAILLPWTLTSSMVGRLWSTTKGALTTSSVRARAEPLLGSSLATIWAS